MADVEKLIIEVEKNRILYDLRDREYKDVKKKSDIWKEIAYRAGFENGECACKKWTNIKDAYVQYIRKLRTRSGQGLHGKVAKYKWADQLQFLNDYTTARSSCSNLDPVDSVSLVNGEQEMRYEVGTNVDLTEGLLMSESLVTPEDLLVATQEWIDENTPAPAHPQEVQTPTCPSEKYKIGKRNPVKDSDVNAQIIEYLSSKKRKVEPKAKDALELFFLSTLETVKTFPQAKQLEVKRKMTDLIFTIEEELLINEQ